MEVNVDLGKPKIIVLCTHNSARSQMAEAFLRKYAGSYFEVYSAGFEPKEINPYAIKVMEEIGYDLAGHYPKKLEEFLGRIHFGIIITVCQKAEQTCPTLPGFGTRIFWPFEDPSAFTGSEEEKIAKFRDVRDQIHEQVKKWLRQRKILEE
jgi:arsenate reductase (thioredoxin)